VKRLRFMAEHNEIGKIGENIATSFLMKQGFIVIERNYRILQGEIDIIAKKDNVLRFVEVKSIKVRDCSKIEDLVIKPEDNLTFAKWSKLLIATQVYLKHKNVPHETKYQVDLACVYIDTELRQGRVKLMQNIQM
jgi:putative endonuclease